MTPHRPQAKSQPPQGREGWLDFVGANLWQGSAPPYHGLRSGMLFGSGGFGTDCR
jgi:hypothetical protein